MELRHLLVVVVLAALIGCDGDLRFAPEQARPPNDARADGSDAGSSSRCTSDAECAFASLHCEPASGGCFACVVDAHCSTGDRPRCDAASRRCVECGVTADCGDGKTCDPAMHRCVRTCDGDAAVCPGEQPVCDATRRSCACTSTSCGSGDGSQCDPMSGSCVECLVDAQCSGDKPRCLDHECHKCRTDADCPGKRCDVVSFDCVN